MSRVRIVCKGEPPMPRDENGTLYLNGVATSWPDIRVYAVDEHGEEHEMNNVRSISFNAGDKNALEPLVVMLECYDVELDIQAHRGMHPDERLILFRYSGLSEAQTSALREKLEQAARSAYVEVQTSAKAPPRGS